MAAAVNEQHNDDALDVKVDASGFMARKGQ